MKDETSSLLNGPEQFQGLQNDSPDKLAQLIRKEHQLLVANSVEFRKQSAMRAVKIGMALLAAKPKIPHGKWLQYVSQCGLAESTAQMYMQIARRPDEWRTTVPDAELESMTVRRLRAFAAKKRKQAMPPREEHHDEAAAMRVPDEAEQVRAILDTAEHLFDTMDPDRWDAEVWPRFHTLYEKARARWERRQAVKQIDMEVPHPSD